MNYSLSNVDTFTTDNRMEWRDYLSKHFETSKEIWFIFPVNEAGEDCISYNDAVEEALCFGWIDSTNKYYDDFHRARRFTARKKGSSYSQPNIERLIWLESHGMLHPKVREAVLPLITKPFVFPKDIIEVIQKDENVWNNFLKFTDSYRRIRVAYIDASRDRPDEFRRRLENFIEKTRNNTLIRGYGGIDKYYK